MRKISFRAWDSDMKTMLNFVDGEGIALTFYSDGSIGLTSDTERLFHNNFTLMQFTGLHDKNGVEIYEGDILSDEDVEKCVVEWYDAGFILSGVPTYEGWSAVDFEEREVIGNIYEHKDLLK